MRSRRTISHLAEILALAGALVVLAGACSPPVDSNLGTLAVRNAEDGKVRIGVVGALSGSLSYVGKATLAGARFAVDVRNDDGGVLGEDVELVSCDGEFSPAAEKTCLVKLVSSDHVDAVVLDDPTLAFVEPKYLDSLEIPVLLPVFAPEDMDPTVYPNTFGLEQIPGTLEVLTAHLANGGFTRLGIVASDDVVFEDVLADLRVQLEAAGVAPVAIARFSPGDVDLSGQVGSLKDAGADVMVILGLGADAARAVLAAGDLGYHPQIAGTQSLYMTAYRDLAAEATNGTLLTLPGPGDADEVDPDFLFWMFDYFRRYGVKTITVAGSTSPDYPGLEIPAYELTSAVLTAMQNAGNTQPGAVTAELERDSFDGVARSIDWDVDTHLGVVDPPGEMWMARFRDGHVLYDVDPRSVPALEEARVALESWAFSGDVEADELDMAFAAGMAQRYLEEIESRRDDIVAQTGQERYDELHARVAQAAAVATALAEEEQKQDKDE